LSGCPAEGPEKSARPTWQGARRARDEVHERERDQSEGADGQGVRARGHRGREGWTANETEADVGLSRSRRADGEVPNGRAVQARFGGADARAAAGLPVPLCRGEAIGDANGANRKGDARDI